MINLSKFLSWFFSHDPLVVQGWTPARICWQARWFRHTPCQERDEQGTMIYVCADCRSVFPVLQSEMITSKPVEVEGFTRWQTVKAPR